MLTINSILILSICLFFPLSLYQNYLTYIKTLELKEKSIFLEFSLYCSLLLLFRFNSENSIYLSVFYSIPLILSLRIKDYRTSMIICLLTILFSKINPIVLIIKQLLYLLIFTYFKRGKYQYILSIILEFIFITYVESAFNYFNIIIPLIFSIFLYLEIKFFIEGSKLTDLNTVLQELNREKMLRSSISKLTHELKNPIAVCYGYLEMFDINNSKKATKYISIIKSEITRSKTIIDEFSSYGKLKTIESEAMDLAYLMDDIKDLLEPLFKLNKATLTITFKDEVYINGDYNKLKQVFINLLKNSIEAKQETIPLKVSVEITQKKHQVTTIIKDNGIGMSEEVLNRVSELFFTTKTNGTGLGLAFSKEVIELHKGTFKISSLENIGTTITITLPK